MMSNGHQHNLSIAWLRLWGAVGVQAAADMLPPGDYHAVAQGFASFELRRYRTACFAVETTKEIQYG